MIVLVSGYRSSMISGGIRTAYAHAELLIGMGFPTMVVSPQGHPAFFASRANVFITVPGGLGPDDDVVFPEAVAAGDPFSDHLLGLPCRKHVFVQNHHYGRLGIGLVGNRERLGIAGVYACSTVVARALAADFAMPEPPVVPCVIDTALFRPRPKTLSVAVMPRKRRDALPLIRSALHERHPRWRPVPWIEVDGRHETEVASVLGGAAVFLSLAHNEGLGLPALEAMAAGCVVAGFHGGGGREYATPGNGFWCEEEDGIAGCADALAAALAVAADDPVRHAALLAAGARTAGAYDAGRAAAALRRYFTAARRDTA